MKMIHGMSAINFDLLIARKYKHKVENAKNRGIEFTLTFAQFRSIFTRKRCAYTGRKLVVNSNNVQTGNDLTLERVNANKGYTIDNVVAVCYAANNIKGVFEDPQTPLSINDAILMFRNIDRLQKERK